MSQMNKLDQRQQLMVVTMEECGELVQACSKILRRQELYADTKYVQNLKDEIGDVYTMLKLMVEQAKWLECLSVEIPVQRLQRPLEVVILML